ncbi:4Fe-4S binding protein [Heliobacterium chlorum]|uniref:4Fe-4S binding protein n=1 Tax=Heliobacterium chlorum TaxID=2698 RepID=A0ABR7T050_HELCL|nr:4Fe-4S dicluster domain-containing protein [Heliobacterium chlorum]MBC9784173.1 4Fe-4S binding protein [Heliobacterium chlorum]
MTHLPPFALTACRGDSGCRYKVLDTASLATPLNDLLQRQCQNLQAGSAHSVLRLALSGCPNSCSQPQIRDFGLQGRLEPLITDEPCLFCHACVQSCPEGFMQLNEDGPVISDECLTCGRCVRACPSGTLQPGKSGWTLLAGGKLGRTPKLAVPVGHWLSHDEVTWEIITILQRYLQEAAPGERLRSWLERSLWKEEIPKVPGPLLYKLDRPAD